MLFASAAAGVVIVLGSANAERVRDIYLDIDVEQIVDDVFLNSESFNDILIPLLLLATSFFHSDMKCPDIIRKVYRATTNID